jgi:gliding motility-associated-like protein
LQTGLSNTFLINWSTGEEGDGLVVSDPGTYTFVAMNDCSEVIDSVVVEQQDQLLPFNNRRLELCLGDTITLDASVINADAYTWEDNQGFRAARPFFEAGTYLLTATNTCDTTSYQVIVTTENCCEIYIPNAFSPNADGINDQFRPESRAASCNLISGWSLRVYDRWGGEVFATNLFGTGWDGRRNGEALDPGVYAYVLEYFDGLNQREVYGDITLLR